MDGWINGWMEREGRRGVWKGKYTNKLKPIPRLGFFSKATISDSVSWLN